MKEKNLMSKCCKANLARLYWDFYMSPPSKFIKETSGGKRK